jgi:hypothetical protein
MRLFRGLIVMDARRANELAEKEAAYELLLSGELPPLPKRTPLQPVLKLSMTLRSLGRLPARPPRLFGRRVDLKARALFVLAHSGRPVANSAAPVGTARADLAGAPQESTRAQAT